MSKKINITSYKTTPGRLSSGSGTGSALSPSSEAGISRHSQLSGITSTADEYSEFARDIHLAAEDADTLKRISGIEIIESIEPVDKATEKNLFSALASLAHFLRKDAPDETSHLLKLLGGTITDNLSSQEFTEGALGSGFTLRHDPGTGRSYMEVDELFVRMKALFKELVIQKLSHVGGEIILSPASMKCIRVEELSDRYRCYFEKTDGEREIDNEFEINDQARCQTFNVKEGINNDVSNLYYWRLVVNTGENYIDLSKTDCDTGSTIPAAGDDIVQLGNRVDPERQNAIVLSSYGSTAPSLIQYKGINTYSLSGKEVTVIGKNSKFTGDVVIGENSTGLPNFSEWPDAEDAINEANKKGDEALEKAQTAKDYIDITLPIELRNLQQQIDGQVQAFFEGYNPAPSNYPAIDWKTEDDRSKHGNDTFTNTLTGASWRWSKIGNSWSWVEIVDTEVKEALRLAGEAKDTADGKRRVFITTPYPPYESGDLWTQGPSGDVMRCVKTRVTGDYEPSDWDKASKYTDDSAANKAQELADTLNAKVNDMASDNKLTGAEKQSVKKEWDIINSEFPVTLKQASDLNISVDVYKTAYYDLVNYLNIVMRDPGESIATMAGEYLTTVDGIHILSCGPINLESTNDIDGNYFRSVFKNYSDAKLALNKAISDTIDNNIKENKKEILEVNKALGNFQDNVNGAFKDGIISKAEVDLIAANIITLTVEKKDIDAGYNKILENTYLEGTARTNLSVYKGVYDVAHDNLTTSINNAIADGVATHEEQVEVNSKFVLYGTALAGYQTKQVEANKAIQDKLKDYSDKAQETANSADAKATELQERINDIASDNKLTAVEKQATKKDWDIIDSEFPYLLDQAGKYWINTDAYRQAYYNLSNYLNLVMRSPGEVITTMSGVNLTTVSGEAIYSMGSIDLSGTVSIDGNTFRYMFQVYNNARVVLSKAVTDKAKDEVAKISVTMTSEFKRTEAAISTIAKKVDETNNTISSSGWLTTADGVKIFSSAEFSNGIKLASLFNITPEKVLIKSGCIELDGKTIAGIVEANQITTGKLNVTNNAQIGDFKITNGSLYAESNGKSMSIGAQCVLFSESNVIAGFGTNSMSSTTGLTVPLLIESTKKEVTAYDVAYNNCARFNARGSKFSDNDIALVVIGGVTIDLEYRNTSGSNYKVDNFKINNVLSTKWGTPGNTNRYSGALRMEEFQTRSYSDADDLRGALTTIKFLTLK